MSRFDKYAGFDGIGLPEGAFRKSGPGFKPATLEGGKGAGPAPSPDPNIGLAQQRLAANAERQQTWLETKVIPRMMAEQERASALSGRVAERQMANMDFQLDASKDYIDRYKAVQIPLEDRIISEADSYDNAAEVARRGAEAQADVAQQFGVARGTAMRNLSRMGVNPNSGMAISANSGMATSEALARVGAMNRTREAARSLGWARRMDAAALGRGLPGFASAAGQVSTGAGAGAGQAAVGGINAMGSISNMVNSGYGGANSALGQLGNLGVSSYGIQSQNWKTEMENDPTNAVLGAVAGGVMAYATGGLSTLGAAAAAPKK